VQACPRCRGQLITCGCPWDELASEREFDDENEDDLWVAEATSGPGWGEVISLDDSRPAAPVAPRRVVSFSAAVSPMRGRHHTRLRTLSEWALANGRPCDLDAAALCLDALERHRIDERFKLDRPGVTHVLGIDVRNAASALGTTLPDDMPSALWNVVNWLASDDRLTVDSDPLAALLEPLQCYGGLGPDGEPRPGGIDVDFACQCYLPHDPTCPDGMGQRFVGHDPDTYRAFIVHAHLWPRAADAPLSSFEPLIALSKRLRQDEEGTHLHIDDFAYAGLVDAEKSAPRLWMYHPRMARSPSQLFLDAGGLPWVPHPDRRRKRGFRWVQISDGAAIFRSGLLDMALSARIDREEPWASSW
jgi:hypothetical protein